MLAIGVQEVQSTHYTDFLAPELEKHGYTAIFKKKTTEIYTRQNRFAIDGCATFFRKDRFSLVKKYEVGHLTNTPPVYVAFLLDWMDAHLKQVLT